MQMEQIDTVVIGGGQAGLAMSEHLRNAGIPHLVLERARIAERWRSERWDSLVANGPAWHDRFPGMEFPATDPDAFVPKEQVADYFEAYAKMIEAPIRCGVAVTSVQRNADRPGFRVETSSGVIAAKSVVVATGPFQKPVIPALVAASENLAQLHSSAYRNPSQLADGAVLVVGAGSSGVQIAEELMLAGRKVYLSVGPHDRPPRAYRGRDFVWWLGVLGKWDIQVPAHVTIAVSGARGGHTVDFRRLAAQGMTLLGRAEGFDAGVLRFAPDLKRNIQRGDANYLSLLNEADAYLARNGMDLPEEPAAREIPPDPACLRDPVHQLSLAEAGITTILWATGFVADFSWLKLDGLCDDAGNPHHQRGISVEPGLYFLGLPRLSQRGSSFIWGVWHDARYLADHILTQRKYLAYHTQARLPQTPTA
jgi:putative flavoprotein involved in K+ transport